MRLLSRLVAVVLAGLVAAAGPLARQVDAADPAHETFQPGDVFVGANDGKVEWRLPDGTLNKVLDTGASTSETTGMAFDFAGNLYVTAFQANQIFKFDTTGELIGPWGGGYNSHPESIVFNADGYAYVGQADGSRDILEFAPGGFLTRAIDAVTEDRGTDWIDLASDQCTLRYTSEGSLIKQVDVCTAFGIQLPDWGTLPDLPSRAYALRMIGDDTVLVADWLDIRWLDASGNLIRTFDADGEDAWFALNLDPDGTSFWSANYSTGKVHRFDLATGAVLQSFISQSGEVSGLAVFGEFTAGAVRSCDSEDLSGEFGQIDPVPGNDERVTVVYDARILAEQDAAAIGEAMAVKVKDRAESSLRSFRDDLDLPIPEAVRIEIRCLPHLGPVPIDESGFVGEPGVIQLRADDIKEQLGGPARDGFPVGDEWNQPTAFWKNLVDHEIFHTVQYLATDLRIEGASNNFTLIESPARAAQDLLADVDDEGGDARSSYLQSVRLFRDTYPTAASINPLGTESYQSASIMQYWGERFGPQNEPNLERRVARFLYTLMDGPYRRQTDDYAATIGYDWTAGAYGTADAVAALRDYYLAHYALRASNVSAAENAQFAILDAETPHGAQGSDPAEYPAILINANKVIELAPGQNTRSLPVSDWSGDVYELTFPADTSHVALHVDSSAATGAFSTAIVPIDPGEAFALDSELMFSGPASFAPVDKRVEVIGADRLALVFVHAGQLFGDVNLEITATPVQGQPAITFLPPDTHELRTATSGPVVLNVQATVDGVPVTGDLPRSAFGVRIGAAAADVRTVDYRGGHYHIEAWAPPSIGAGTYPLTLEFLEQDFAAPGSVVIDESLPEHWERVAGGGLGELAQGESATAQATVTPGATAASFALAWQGSTFDLTLTSPSGRVIPSTSTDPDVTVSQTATTIEIAVDVPESGSWQLQASGTDVPTPEAVSYEVTEADAPLASSLYVGDEGQAGLPLEVRFSFAEPADAILDGDVAALVTDPAGVSRWFTLRDDGASLDNGTDDGVYGALLWATDLAGDYEVTVTAHGTSAAGAPVERFGSATITLGAKVDGDGDGVADAAELLLGFDPANPADGASDLDRDGLSVANELAAGSDPVSWDGDGGGESDRSELAAGRDPAFAEDDADTEEPSMGAEAVDGNLVSITAGTASGSGSVHLYRLTETSTTDLGLHPGGLATFDDGPLATGTYSYLAVGVTPAGVESAPTIIGPVEVAADVTPPIARITLNQGAWDTTVPDVQVTFTDLSEPVTEMRLALSEEELASSAWVPYSAFTSVAIPATAGQHFIYVQVRDAAGNESRVVAGFVFLVVDDPGPIVTERVSVSSQQGQANGNSSNTWMSADGRYVVFHSAASNLVDGDTNGVDDVFIHDRVTDTTTRVSVASDGTQADDDSHDPAISADGRYVVFRSYASNLVAGDTNGQRDIFVHDRDTGVTERVSVPSGGGQANGFKDAPNISADGRYVSFSSNGSNLVADDTNGKVDVFVHDRETDTTTRVSVASDGIQGDGDSVEPIISRDGRWVAFDSLATNLVAGDTNLERDVFLHDRDTGTTIRVSVAGDGSQANDDSEDASISADGRYVAFDSSATNLVAADANGKRDIFVYDRTTGATELVSLADDGDQGTNESRDAAISADGRWVAFMSLAPNLVDGDSNGRRDIFVRDRTAGTTTRRSVATDGSQGNDHSTGPAIPSDDGSTVSFLSTASNLVPDDTNASKDVFVRGPDQ